MISSDAFLSVPDSDLSSDSSEMVKAIIQTVQNQDKVLKDLYTHLRWEQQEFGFQRKYLRTAAQSFIQPFFLNGAF